LRGRNSSKSIDPIWPAADHAADLHRLALEVRELLIGQRAQRGRHAREHPRAHEAPRGAREQRALVAEVCRLDERSLRVEAGVDPTVPDRELVLAREVLGATDHPDEQRLQPDGGDGGRRRARAAEPRFVGRSLRSRGRPALVDHGVLGSSIRGRGIRDQVEAGASELTSTIRAD
jgi:hypothetical protein